MDLNRATILGRLTRDPEVRTTPNGKTVASIGVATSRAWTDQTGAKQEKTEFHNVVLWGRLGEIAGQYLTKGKQVYLEGRLETRDWTGQDGVKRYRTEIIAESMIMLGGPRGSAGGSDGEKNFSDGASSASAQPSSFEGDGEEIKVEDIPF